MADGFGNCNNEILVEPPAPEAPLRQDTLDSQTEATNRVSEVFSNQARDVRAPDTIPSRSREEPSGLAQGETVRTATEGEIEQPSDSVEKPQSSAASDLEQPTEYNDDYDDNDTSPSRAPLLPHEYFPPSYDAPLLPHESFSPSPTLSRHGSLSSQKILLNGDLDFNDSTLEPFPTDREGVISLVRSLSQTILAERNGVNDTELNSLDVMDSSTLRTRSGRHSRTPSTSMSLNAISEDDEPDPQTLHTSASNESDSAKSHVLEAVAEIEAEADHSSQLDGASTEPTSTIERPRLNELPRDTAGNRSLLTPPQTPEIEAKTSLPTSFPQGLTPAESDAGHDDEEQNRPAPAAASESFAPRDDEQEGMRERAVAKTTSAERWPAMSSTQDQERRSDSLLSSLWYVIFGSWLGPLGVLFTKFIGTRGRAT